MYKRSRSGTIKQKRSRRKARGKKTKLYSKIVAFIKNNKPEIKQGRNATDYALNSTNELKAINIAKFITHGDEDNQFQGKKIRATWVTCKYQVSNLAEYLDGINPAFVAYFSGQIKFHIAIISIPGTADTITGGNQIFDQNFTNSPMKFHFDPEKCKVHAFKTHTIINTANELADGSRMAIEGNPMEVAGMIKCRLNRQWTYRDTTNRILDNRQYFIMTYCSGLSRAQHYNPAFSVIRWGYVFLDSKLYFSDI